MLIVRDWQHIDIKTRADAEYVCTLWSKTWQEIIAAAFDSETDGLHIIHCRAFMYQFGWVTKALKGYTFAVDIERTPELAKQVICWWHKAAAHAPIYAAHNVKFDLHMEENMGLPYRGENITDTLFYIRYAHDALKPENGGPPLKLKEYAAQYITPSAKAHEKLLDSEKSSIAKSINIKLKERLAYCSRPPAKYKAKSYTLSVVNDMFKDSVFSVQDLPEDARNAYYDWLSMDVPIWLQNKVNGLVDPDDIPYNKLNRDNVRKYAHFDIVWVLEIVLKLSPVITARKNEAGLEIENKLIYPLLEMERVGFDADVEYLHECEGRVAAYIKERRQELYRLAGEELKIGQAKRIMQLFKDRYDIALESTASDSLKTLRSNCLREHTHEDVIAFINVIEELRTLEKWYATYILRFMRDLRQGSRLYTTIHQVGTVSGRVTSDFQQFPKKPIKTKDGVELFHPRRLIRTNTALVYLDFSQIELRFQALYTILVGHPDLNLCRAYMPLQCTHPELGEFDYNNQEHIKRWHEPWFYNENPEKQWEPTDVHGATTKAAFDIDESHPDYHNLRYVGKRVNFSKNYGAQYAKICLMFPERTAEECRKIDGAYYAAFPGVKEYHTYCYARAQYACTENLYGVRYYNVSGHKLINMLVQGSSAFYLKIKILELYEYRKAHNLKTQWQMQIHDELSWEWDPADPIEHFFEFKRIMEDWPDGIVPVVAEMEATTSTWAAKVEVHTLEELQQTLCACTGPVR